MAVRGSYGVILAAVLAGAGLTADIWRRTHPRPGLETAPAPVPAPAASPAPEPEAAPLPKTETRLSSLDMIKTEIVIADPAAAPDDPAPSTAAAPALAAVPAPVAAPPAAPKAPTAPAPQPAAPRDFRRGLVPRQGFELRHVETTGPATTSAVAKLAPPLAPDPPAAVKPAAPKPAADKPAPPTPKVMVAPPNIMAAAVSQPAQAPNAPNAPKAPVPGIQIVVPAVRICTTGTPRQHTHNPVTVFASGPQAGELAAPVLRDYWCESGAGGTRLWLNQAARRCYADKECCESGGGACSTPTEQSPFVRVIARRADL